LDGGVITNYPLHYLTEKERLETLGIMITYRPALISALELQDYLTRPLSLFTQSRSHQDYAMFKEQTVNIRMDSRSPVDFEMTTEQKMGLMELGLVAAKTFLKGYRKPVRRYSVS
jgi:hypothetical protein